MEEFLAFINKCKVTSPSLGSSAQLWDLIQTHGTTYLKFKTSSISYHRFFAYKVESPEEIAG